VIARSLRVLKIHTKLKRYFAFFYTVRYLHYRAGKTSLNKNNDVLLWRTTREIAIARERDWIDCISPFCLCLNNDDSNVRPTLLINLLWRLTTISDYEEYSGVRSTCYYLLMNTYYFYRHDYPTYIVHKKWSYMASLLYSKRSTLLVECTPEYSYNAIIIFCSLFWLVRSQLGVGEEAVTFSSTVSFFATYA
jgi:hypothetical protein